MILALAAIVISLVIGCIAYKNSWRDQDRIINGLMGTFISAVCFGAILVTIYAVSWVNYAKDRAFFDTTMEVHRGAITLYEDKSKIDLDLGILAATDLRYMGYQENMKEFIKNLQYRVASYNESIVKKKLFKRSIFGWVIRAPDEDMKLIDLLDGKEQEDGADKGN